MTIETVGQLVIEKHEAMGYGYCDTYEVKPANGDVFRSAMVFKTLAGARRAAAKHRMGR